MQGVDVKLLDLSKVGNQLRQANQYFFKGFQIRRRCIPVALQQPIHPGLPHQPSGKQAVERRQGNRTILQHLREDSPHTE